MSLKNKKQKSSQDIDNIKNDKNDKNDGNDKNDKNDLVDVDKNKLKSQSITSSNLHSPYIDKSLLCPIMLYPNQMDNKMYLHLKLNLKNKLEGKCYKNYGFINKIYTIEETSDGIIEAEDPTCSAKIIVRFTCNLCLPIVNKEIICKIDRMNKALISAINGPIRAIITADKINKEHFFPDMNRNIRVKKTSEVVIPDMYVKVIVLSKSFSDYDKNILVIGFLQDIATEEEINQYYLSTQKIADEMDAKFEVEE